MGSIGIEGIDDHDKRLKTGGHRQAEGTLATLKVLRPFDRGDDSELQIFSCHPSAGVGHAVLQRRIEQLY